jgi:HEPN domain-containing protein
MKSQVEAEKFMDNKMMNNDEYAREWLQFAEMDLSSANHLLTHYPMPVEIICYLCQQSSEKNLKSLLVLNNIRPPRTHDLIELLILCKSIIADFSSILKQCNSLNKYSVAPRYPREIAVSESDARTALSFAQNVLNLVKSHFPRLDTPYVVEACGQDA